MNVSRNMSCCIQAVFCFNGKIIITEIKSVNFPAEHIFNWETLIECSTKSLNLKIYQKKQMNVSNTRKTAFPAESHVTVQGAFLGRV